MSFFISRNPYISAGKANSDPVDKSLMQIRVQQLPLHRRLSSNVALESENGGSNAPFSFIAQPTPR
jgi:hypothetical protein